MAVSVIGNEKREWTLGVSCCLVVGFFMLPSLQRLPLRTMPTGTIDTLCGHKSIIIIGGAVIGSKQKGTVHCRRTLSDSQMLCVCSCYQKPRRNLAPVQYFSETKGRCEAGVTLKSEGF